ncbi:F-box only protein 43 [Pangasianodon hypophthalmus]|uniref:F-box only protein 43 n=1 Tax=Pangasianodon hypophthalmus TaxID=310915 RepID=UPI000F00D8C2|nr:F-box only protein 43 [Pangasianodon hypophthalmus]XP_053095542.1 F-box only protein 43 [Pangasianodon hypophthalmus]XP_053095569.1 F-box only protein 43 [Pangasianodon hypophthalmus]
MESAGCVQKPIHHPTCGVGHAHGDDAWTRGEERVHFSTADTPKENMSSSQRRGRDRHYLSHSQWCETPKLTRKDVSLRRRLLTSKSMTVVKTPSCRDACTHGASESPDVLLRGPLSYSTLRSDAVTTSCMKRRLVFSQAVTSTLEDGGDGASPPLSEPDLDESIISGLLPSETPEMLRERDSFRTPVTRLVADLSESLSVLSTPSRTPLSGLDAAEDSGFGSLRLDGSEDGSDDGSFQEGAPQVAFGRDHRRSRLERQRRLSTLREGSQSDDEVKGQRVNGRGLKLEEEVFAETPPLRAMQRDLSLTPALQAMEALSRSFTLSHDLSHDPDQPITARLPLSHLIGRKMGLGKLDVLTELHVRNLHHVLSSILQLLSTRDIHTCSQVCDSWSDIILQDRKANRRRRMYEREQKHALEMGGAARVVDAETRLALACRSALGSVQAQAKTPSTRAHTPAASGARAHTPPSTKRQQFLQVAKTLFSEECLRPCPRCERPARCHSVKAEGVCSWSECVFHFCTSCLRAYHGSADCTRLPNMRTCRKGRSHLLPGSAQSKRNVKRL